MNSPLPRKINWPPIAATIFVLAAPLHAHDAAEVVEKVRAALGIDAFEKSDRAVRLSGPLEFAGLKGTQTAIFDAAGRFKEKFDAQLSRATVFDGKTVRARDIGGEVVDQALGDRTEALFGAWAASGLWFSGDRATSLVLDDDAGDEKTVDLTFSLDDGRAAGSVTIDRKTWRPIRWQFDDPVSKSTMEFEGELRVGPLRLPRKITAKTENGSVTISEFTQAELIPIPDWSAELADLAPTTSSSVDAAAAARLEVRRAPTGHLMVHPRVNGKDLGWFIFDTGAGQNVLDLRAIEEADLETFAEVPAVGAGGATTASFCRPRTLQLGPLTLRNSLAAGMDLAFLDAHMGEKIAGIIGYGTLAQCVVEFEVSAESISVFDPATYKLAKGDWTPLILYDRVPAVPGRFEDHDAVFRLDTGAGGTVMFHAPTVERLKLLDGRKTQTAMYGGVGGMKSSRSGRIKWLEFGGQRQKKVEAGFATEAVGAFADPYIDGNIGTDLLSESVMVLDYPHSRIAFQWKPSAKKKAAERVAAHAPQSNKRDEASSKRRSSPSSVSVTPMKMENDRPVIDVRVQGRGPFRFVFDTGAGVAILSPELAEKLKIESSGKTRIGDPAAPHAVEVDTATVDFEICGEKFKDVSAVVWGDKAILAGLGDVDGIVGLPAISDRVVTLDFAKKELRLSKEPLPEGDGTVTCWSPHGIPLLDLSIGGETVPAHLDTGMTRDLSVPSELRDKLTLKGSPTPARARTASGEFELEIATLDGPAEIAGQKIVDPDLEFNKRFEHAVVGTGVLSRFTVELDLDGGRARFTPIPGWKPDPSQKRRYGMMMSMSDGPVTIAGVVPKSIAERAGLKTGDRIVKANGRVFESLNFSERGKVLKQSPLALVIERDGKPIEITLAFDDVAQSGDDSSP
ncbi:MAG TPA: aspartyl protease family protein [Phycisphaerae bacterium]|nr:aspartyl protease family protein [Phycisphaerae bacterium]